MRKRIRGWKKGLKQFAVFCMSAAMVLELCMTPVMGAQAAEGSQQNVWDAESVSGGNQIVGIQDVSGGSADAISGDAAGEYIRALFLDSFEQCQTWIKTSGAGMSTPVDTSENAKEGTSALRLKLQAGTGNGYEWLKILSNPIGGLSKEEDALQFWFNPIVDCGDIQAGIVCEKNGSYPTLRISLSDYLEKGDYGDWKWKKITIPLSELADHGTCYDDAGNVADKESFDWNRIVGMTIGGSTQGLENQVHWCRLDEVVFVKYQEGGEEPEEPVQPEEYVHIRDLFLDSFDQCKTWIKTSGAGMSTPVDTSENAKEGTSALRLKLQEGTGNGYEWLKILSDPIDGLNKEQDALQFWFNPIIARGDVQVGIVCEINGSYPTLRVSLNDYLEEGDYGDWKWKKITIPLSELLENGTCYDDAENIVAKEKFDWKRIVGMTIGGTTEGLASQAHWCRLDDVAFVKYQEGGTEEKPEDAVHIKDIFLDSFEQCSAWITSSGAGMSTPIDTNENVKEGTSALRLKLQAASERGYEWLKILTSPISGIDKDKAALQFWFNPLISRRDVQVGIVCESNGAYPSLRISLNDYLEAGDYGDWKWKQITIPLSELLENGICYDGNENVIDAEKFNWNRISGVVITGSTEDAASQISWCRLDEIAFVEYNQGGSTEAPEEIPEVFYEASVLEEEYQTITGWGVYPSNQEIDTFGDKKAVHEALFRDLGITRFRLELRGSVVDKEGNFTNYMDSLVAKLKIGVEEYGVEEYTLNIWSPPSSMKTNGNYASGKNPDGSPARLLEEKEQEFCDYIVKSLNHLKKQGLPAPIALSMQNEPGTATEYQSCWYDRAQFTRVLLMLRKTLDQAGYQDLKLMAPESDEYKNSVTWLGHGFSALEENPEYADAIDIIASHSYKGKDATDQDVINYAANTAKYPDKEVWMTEYCTAGNQMGEKEIDRAIEASRILISDMAWAGNNSWFWWLGWDPRYEVKDSYQEVILAGEGRNSVYKGTIYQILAQLYHSVPVGSTVRRMSTDDDTVVNNAALLSDMVAFDTVNGTVCMISNASDTAKAYDISGLEGNSVCVYTACETDESMQEKKCINVKEGKASQVYIPARSVNILVTTGEDTAAPDIVIEKNDQLFESENGYVSRSASIRLNGKVDEEAVVKINGTETALGEGYSFSADLTLQEGSNIITVTAEDVHGNKSQKEVRIVYDPSYLALLMEKTSDKVNDKNYTIRGKVNVDAVVTINGEEVAVAQDLTFEKQVMLEEGSNEYTITATDRTDAAVSRTVAVKISCDSISPVITLDNRDETVNDSEYVIGGKVSETLESLYAGGTEIVVNMDDTFLQKISLQEGQNRIEITATDLYGNTGTAVLNIEYQKTENSPQLPDPANAVAYAPKAQKSVEIDGDLTNDGWMINQKASKAISGNPNNIFNFGTMWDEENLYFAAVVKDGLLLFGHQNVYNNDCVEVFLNPTNSKSTFYEPDKFDMQLFVGYDKDRQNLYQNADSRIRGAWKDIEGGYSVELVIPWESIGITAPAEGLEIGFDVANDDQDILGSRQSVIGWAGTSDNWKDTSNFGTLVLAGESGEPENPDEPDTPGEPETPSEPDNSGEPETPGEPDTPGEPETSGEPETPEGPDGGDSVIESNNAPEDKADSALTLDSERKSPGTYDSTPETEQKDTATGIWLILLSITAVISAIIMILKRCGREK